MSDFDERREALGRQHLTSSALTKEVLKKQAVHIGNILAESGYYFGGRIVDTKIISGYTRDDKQVYEVSFIIRPWDGGELFEHGKLTFCNLRKGGAPFLERDLPYELDREAEDALSMTVSNRGDTVVTRQVARDVEVGSTQVKTREDQITWDLSFGYEATAGIGGNTANYGATALVTLSGSFGIGGSHTIGSSNEESSTITRSVSDSFDVSPRSKYKIVGTCDKITLRQDYRIYYPIDYDVEIALGDFGVSKYEIYNKFYVNPDSWFALRGLDVLISAYLGYPILKNKDFTDEIINFLDERPGALEHLEALSDKDNRMIVQRGTITYNDASDISMGIWKLGTYDDKGELIV